MATVKAATPEQGRPQGLDADRLLTRAKRLHSQGRHAEALECYHAVLERHPDDPDALHLLGLVALQAGRLHEAVELISRALSLRAEFPEALNNLASAMLALGQLDQAERLLEAALKMRPEYADALSNLGAIMNMRERPEDAVAYLEQAVTLNPQAAMAHNNLGNALRDLGRLEEAGRAYARALELDSNKPAYAAASGALSMQLGKHDRALALFSEALDRDPLCIPALCGVVASKRIRPGDPEVELFRRAAARIASMSLRDQVEFLFAWGKLHDDIGDYDNAFKCLAEANRLRRRQRPYSQEQEELTLAAILEAYSAERLARLAGGGPRSELPVFIVGMPRSGTTLVEQMISAHPKVFGAGELKTLGRIVTGTFGVSGPRDIVEGAKELDAAKLRQMGETYLAEVTAQAPQALRITDKMPTNFWHLGLIRLMLPDAKVVHVRRNPLDTLLSCFQQNFGEGQAFSNDLTDAGHFYKLYLRVMQRWRELLPGFMLEVDYEDLVSQPEACARRLIDFIGLEWDEACLRPSENRRSVKTASQWQVRQPVHTQSVERWRRYEAHLGPLLEAVHATELGVPRKVSSRS